jgi:DNA polymerase III subunit delta
MVPPSPAPAAGTWLDARPAPLVLVFGPEELLASRAVDAIVSAVRADHGTVAVTNLSAAAYERGSLRAATSPSLFAEPGVVVIDEGESMTDDFLEDAVAYAKDPDPEVVVILRHGGAVRGKRALEAWRAAGVEEILCPAIKRDADLAQFVEGEFARATREARPQAVRALVDAVGGDVPELAAAVHQLLSDVSGLVTEDEVTRYYGSRVNATGFAVADAAIVGKVGEALALVRHALDTGTDPVPLVAALASKLRGLARVGAARGRGIDPAKDLSMAPWQVERARRDLRHWNGDTLAAAIEAAAAADAEVKGAGRDPRFAIERAVRTVATLASR